MYTIAIMQPYFFPYLGYYQLVNKSDKFIFLDDVNYIKKGYINRNSIKYGDNKLQFSIPVNKASQNRHINEHFYKGDFSKFIKQLEVSYSKAPNYSTILDLILGIIESDDLNVSTLNSKTISSVFSYIGIGKKFDFSSNIEIDLSLKGQDRIISLCESEGATNYVNASGGRDLYRPESFREKSISLQFLNHDIESFKYDQNCRTFLSSLSMIDALMYLDTPQLRDMVEGGNLES